MPRKTPVKALYEIPHKIKYIIVQLGDIAVGETSGYLDSTSADWGVGFDFEIKRIKIQLTTETENIPITSPGQGVFIEIQQTEDWERIFVQSIRPFFITRGGTKQFDHMFHLPRRVKIYEGNKLRVLVENRLTCPINGSIFIYGWLVK